MLVSGGTPLSGNGDSSLGPTELARSGYLNSSQAEFFEATRPFLSSRCAFSRCEGELDPRSRRGYGR